MASTVSVTVKDCTITVTHKIYFDNPDNLSKNEFWFCTEALKKQIREKWEKPDFKYNCCKVKFSFEYPDKPGPDTDTKKLYTDWEKFHKEHKGLDYGRSFQDALGPKQSTGTWFLLKNIISEHYNCDAAAHEVGHELGADDKYIEEWKNDGTSHIKPDPKPGYPKDGIMFNHNGTVQQQDIDEIMKALNATCPEGCCGKNGR
jgi:hypothetical protein